MKPVKEAILFLLLIVMNTAELKAQSTTQDSISSVLDSLKPADPELTRQASLYYRNLTVRLDEVKTASYYYLQTITKLRRAKAIDNKRKVLLQALQRSRELCRSSAAFHGDSTLKVELIRYLDLVTIVLKEDFGKILDMEDIAAQTYDQQEAHQLAIDLAVDKLRKSFDVVKTAENDFFKKYQIKATEQKDEMLLKIEKANKAIEYYNGLMKIVNKVNKEYSYAGESVSKKDFANLQQHTTTLVSFADEALAELKQKKAYEGDNEMLAIAIKSVEFYRYNGQVTFPANIEFSLKADNVQNAYKRLSSIKESDRKKEDVDRYNNEINLYNKAVKEINKLNSDSYKMHKQLTKLWNKAEADFFKKHT